MEVDAGPSRASQEPDVKPPSSENGAPGDDGLPSNATETLYLHNLNEKVRIPVMKETLASLFKPYHPIGPIVAHRNVRMRGQAFVSFRDKATAVLAQKDVNEFPLYGKPIIIDFAKTRSDAVVERQDGEEGLEEWKKTRLADKSESRAQTEPRRNLGQLTSETKRKTNVIRQRNIAKHKAGGGAGGGGGDDAGPGAAKKPKLQMPDEYLPPNNVLFVQNLPEGTTQEDLREVFEQYAGLVEIRTIAAKKDIAFVEFADETASAVAKDALHNFKIDGETKMKVTFARK